MMILEYGCVEDHLASKRVFSGRFLGLVNNSGYMASGRQISLTIRLTPAERQTLLAWQRATTAWGRDGLQRE